MDDKSYITHRHKHYKLIQVNLRAKIDTLKFILFYWHFNRFFTIDDFLDKSIFDRQRRKSYGWNTKADESKYKKRLLALVKCGLVSRERIRGIWNYKLSKQAQDYYYKWGSFDSGPIAQSCERRAIKVYGG
ncbi:MAG TPA: hypothetical protein P5277_02525 [Candidatus Paceibacterota bacterium]|nr:hypothetical protein [Candidatus Paceibacterota bacterium]